jgi:class 3 adenylate cyclase/tetratricopeptide (TPR) repeat protein
MRTCSVCGAEAMDNARFCPACGTSFVPACRSCGAELPAGARFCPSCATPVEKAQGGEERKLVTVLFADVTGSTGLGERLDPEQLRDVMSSYFEAMRQAIEVEGGTVEKFIGDAVMAAFGVPTAHEDDPIRALRAALGMRSRLDELNGRLSADHGISLRMRVGVNTGEVVAATAPNPGESMVSGDAVNVAARLEQSASPGQIVVSERTARAARGFAFRELGALRLKGKDRTVAAVELVGETAAGPERGVPGLAAPMVGRDNELAVLTTLYERVASEKRPYLVTLYGDAGVGKSRLVVEFLTWAEHSAPPPRILRGRCLPYGDGVTYWPLAEILKGHAGVLDTDPPELALGKIRKIANDLFDPDSGQDPERITAALAYTVGIEHPDISYREVAPRQVRNETFAAWRSFLSVLSSNAPVVVVVEDIHWADGAMLDLLQDLADRMQGPALIVCPARPELIGRRPDWGGGSRSFSSIFLEPLSAADADRLVALLLTVEDLPDTVHRRILERAEGNPFFLEEIVRQLIDAGRIVRSEERWRAVADIEDVEIPDTVQAVLASRIDLLEPSDKRALQLAAVVGRVFWPGPVARLLDGESELLDDTLDRLQDRELILGRVSSSMGGQPEYIFKHVLTRDVAYESLPRGDRIRAHAEAARWIEETAGDRRLEFVELLAHHYGQAHRAARQDPRTDPAESERLRARAFESLLAASSDARRKLASTKAHRLAGHALEFAMDDAERSVALGAMGNASQDQYDGDEAWRCFREGADAREAAGAETTAERLELAMLCARAVEVPTRWPGSMRTLPDEQEVRQCLDLGLRVAPPGDSEPRCRLLAAQAFWMWAFVGSTSEEAVRFLEAGNEAAEMALRMGRADLASGALDGVGSILMTQERYSDGKDVIARRLELLDRIDDPLEVGDIFSLAAWVRFDLGMYEEALGFAAQGYERTVETMPTSAVHCQAWLAMARFRLGRWDGFVEDLDVLERLLGDRRHEPPYFAVRPFGTAAVVYETRGEPAAADRVIAVVEWMRGQGEGRGSLALAFASLALARRGDVDAAWAYSDEALANRRAYGPAVWETRCDLVAETGLWDRTPATLASARAATDRGGLLALPAFADRLEGRAAFVEGETETATRLLEQASRRFEEIGARWERACTDLSLAEALLEEGDRAAATSRLKPSLGVFDEVGSLREAARARELLEP